MERALDLFIASGPFERLLAAGERPLVARAGGGRDLVAAALARALDAPVLLLATDRREAEQLAGGCSAFLGAERVAFLPAWESLPYEFIPPTPEVAARRAEAARRARDARGAFVLVAPVVAALQRVPSTIGTVEPLRLAPGGGPPPDDLTDRLVALGYARADLVERRGEFAVRGGIADVFPGTARRPVRLEYLGDEIESMRAFVPATQLGAGEVDESWVHPVREFVPDDAARERARALARRTTFPERIRDGLARVADGLEADAIESLAPLLATDLRPLADLLPPSSWVILDRARRTADRARHAVEESDALAAASDWPGPPALLPLDDATVGRPQLHLSEFAEGLDLGLDGWGTARGNAPEAVRRAAELARVGYRLFVATAATGTRERAVEVLGAAGVRLDDEAFLEADLDGGFIAADARVAVLTDEDLFGSRRHTRSAPHLSRRRDEPSIEELEPGDFAVHRVHGVGRFIGVQHRAVGDTEREYLVLEYAAGDRLSVPTDQVGMIVRYRGGEAPRLNRLGTGEWTQATTRVRRAVRDMAAELVRLYAVREANPGHAFGPDTPWQREMEDAFPHEETRDQLAAIEDVKTDMQRERPMDRLICGDVGFGKTEVAVRAAFKAVMDGKQVAVLVPTTLLAEQHFVTFSERFAPFPVKVAMLSRFLSAAEQKRVLDDLAAGTVDVVIGTHRLISNDVSFADLGLLVVDEEQRFGVAHKERLKRFRATVDVLTMTATPIPRTLEMALSGIRDMSVVDTPPEDRQPVLTSVAPYDDSVALGAVRRELLRGGQVFWLHNRVATLDRRAGWLREALPEARVVTAHGQMGEDDLETAMLRFWNRDADVLVCTTIIESGLDVPSANTLIVERADLLGLAQMYQLRGRVGRSTERAFAYFFFPEASSLTEESHERLATISRHTALGSGYRIALRDLEIRGAGNLLGGEQSGHIAAVGFDTYARLLQEAVAEMRGAPIPVEAEVKIDLPVRAYVPQEWLTQLALRLELYRAIATARDHARLAEVRAEAEDRFGRLPDEVATLLAVRSLAIACRDLGIAEVATHRDEVRVRPIDLDEARTLPRGATYHRASATLNLRPGATPGADLPAWVEAAVRDATRG